MAERRMFSKKIIDSARFLKMPLETQTLYFHLALRADDDGVVEAFSVLRLVGAAEDSLRILVAKGFVTVLNDDLVTHITDWLEHNLIRADRKVDSIYFDLLVKVLPHAATIEKRERADKKHSGQPVDVQWTDNGPHRIGKDRIGQESQGEEMESAQPSTAKNQKPSTPDVADKPEEVSNELWSEWLAIRKTKKQPTPTQRAMQSMADEAGKVGLSIAEAITECCDRGWAGFKAAWYENSQASMGMGLPRKNTNTFDQAGNISPNISPIRHSQQQQPMSKMSQGLAALQALKSTNRGAQA